MVQSVLTAEVFEIISLFPTWVRTALTPIFWSLYRAWLRKWFLRSRRIILQEKIPLKLFLKIMVRMHFRQSFFSFQLHLLQDCPQCERISRIINNGENLNFLSVIFTRRWIQCTQETSKPLDLKFWTYRKKFRSPFLGVSDF